MQDVPNMQTILQMAALYPVYLIHKWENELKVVISYQSGSMSYKI